MLNLQTPNPQNGQTHSNNPKNCLSVFDYFEGLAPKRLAMINNSDYRVNCSYQNLLPT